MSKSNFRFPSHPYYMQGQGLVEYAILITLVGLIAIAGLVLFGGSVRGGLIKVCAAFGDDNCKAANLETDPVIVDSTATVSVSFTSSPVVPTATLKLSEPEPTRGGPALVFTSIPTQVVELQTLRIKLVTSGNGKAGGIQVVLYGSRGEYVTEGVTDDKGNLTLSIPSGSYTISTFYEGKWQKDGPFSTGSKENVIHR